MWDRVRRRDQTKRAFRLSYSSSPGLSPSPGPSVSFSLFLSVSRYFSLPLSRFAVVFGRCFSVPFGRARARKHATSFSLLLEVSERLSSFSTTTRHRDSLSPLAARPLPSALPLLRSLFFSLSAFLRSWLVAPGCRAIALLSPIIQFPLITARAANVKFRGSREVVFSIVSAIDRPPGRFTAVQNPLRALSLVCRAGGMRDARI